jgi:hypothetical protein
MKTVTITKEVLDELLSGVENANDLLDRLTPEDAY